MVESWVEPAISASVNTIMIIAGSASVANITSRLEPMPPKAVPTSMPASARKNRAAPSSAMMAMRSADQLNNSPIAKVGTSAAATQVVGEDDIGDDAEQPRRIVGDARLPCAAAAAGRDRAAAAADRLRRTRRAFTLRTKPVRSGASSSTRSICAPWTIEGGDHGHSASTSSSDTRAKKHEAEILADGQELEPVEPVGRGGHAVRERARR